MSKQPKTQAKRAALDRILAAVNAELNAGTIPAVETAIAWLSYAVMRDQACCMLRDERAEGSRAKWSVADEAQASFDLFCDDRPDFEFTLDGLAAEIGAELDPDFERPIDLRRFRSWLPPRKE